MQSLSIIGHTGGHHTAAQQLLAQNPFQVLRSGELDHEQTLQTALHDSAHTLLVFCPPGVVIARALAQNAQAAQEQKLQLWCEQARTLLRHFMLNRERCTLVNELALLHTPSVVLATLTHKTGQPLAVISGQDTKELPQPLLEALGTSLAYTDQLSASLYRDLEAVADVSSKAAVQQHQTSLREALQKITAQREQAAHNHQALQGLEEENKLLQLHQVHRGARALLLPIPRAHANSQRRAPKPSANGQRSGWNPR